MYNKFFKAFISFTALLLTLAVLGSCSQAPAGNNTDTDGAPPTDTAKDGADDMDNTEKDTNNGDTDSGDNTVKRPPIAYFSFEQKRDYH